MSVEQTVPMLQSASSTHVPSEVKPTRAPGVTVSWSETSAYHWYRTPARLPGHDTHAVEPLGTPETLPIQEKGSAPPR